MSSMSANGCVDVPREAFVAARRAWPGRGHDDRLPAPVRRVFDSWMAVSEDDLSALDGAVREGFARRPGRDSPRAQCQDLTLSGSPLPAAHSNVRLLTAAQIVQMGAPSPSDPPPGGSELRHVGRVGIAPASGQKYGQSCDPRGGHKRGGRARAFPFRPSGRRPGARLLGGILTVTRVLPLPVGVGGGGQASRRLGAAARPAR